MLKVEHRITTAILGVAFYPNLYGGEGIWWWLGEPPCFDLSGQVDDSCVSLTVMECEFNDEVRVHHWIRPCVKPIWVALLENGVSAAVVR